MERKVKNRQKKGGNTTEGVTVLPEISSNDDGGGYRNKTDPPNYQLNTK